MITLCGFMYNTVGDKGGAIYLTYQIGFVVNNSFIGNQAGAGGSIYYEESCKINFLLIVI